MKTILKRGAAGILVVLTTLLIVSVIGGCFQKEAKAQVAPGNFVTTYSIVKAATTTGTTTAVVSPAANKTLQVIGSVASGTGTAAITVQGSLDGTHWDTVYSVSVQSSVGGTSTSTSFTDRYPLLRGNITTLSGSTPTLSVTGAY